MSGGCLCSAVRDGFTGQQTRVRTCLCRMSRQWSERVARGRPLKADVMAMVTSQDEGGWAGVH